MQRPRGSREPTKNIEKDSCAGGESEGPGKVLVIWIQVSLYF